jgi:hypothetical protein
MSLQQMELESCGGFCWKQCKAMPRQDAMANADEAVPAIGGRAEKMTKLETICTSSDAARHQKLHLLRAGKRSPHLLSLG